jgi:hypothetical protein
VRKLVVTENVTLDGVMDLSDGWFEPLNATSTLLRDFL